MQTSLDRHLKNVSRPYSILCDRQFQLFSKNSSDCQIWQSSEISSPNYFQIVQHVVLLHIQIPPYYGIGQIDGNWIFQPFFFTIFPKYIHIVEEVNIFQWGCCLVMIISTKMRTYFLLLFPTRYRSETCVSGYDLKYCSNDVSCSRGDCTSSGQQNCAEGQVCCKCPW